MNHKVTYREEARTTAMYAQALPLIELAFRQLERLVPQPMLVSIDDRPAYRFVEKLPQQAIVLKLVRVVTVLKGTWAVLNAGLTQEAGALQRMLDEFGEDIHFLAGPIVLGKKEPLHDRFLAEVFQEEFDEGKTPLESEQKRDRVPRKKVRAYNARLYAGEIDVSTASKVLGTISSTYSGFVHGAGVHALDIYGGDPPRFHVEGLRGTSRLEDSFADFRNYLHRAVIDTAVAAKALGAEDLFATLRSKSHELAAQFDTVPETNRAAS